MKKKILLTAILATLITFQSVNTVQAQNGLTISIKIESTGKNPVNNGTVTYNQMGYEKECKIQTRSDATYKGDCSIANIPEGKAILTFTANGQKKSKRIEVRRGTNHEYEIIVP